MRLTFLLIIFLLNSFSFTQSLLKVEENEFVINFKNSQHPYNTRAEGSYQIIDFFEATDESKPGFPKIPVKTFYLAIPPEATVKVRLEEVSKSTLSQVLLEKNPKIVADSDSTFHYVESEYDESIIRLDKYPVNEIEILGYTWISDFYVVAIQINPYQYSFVSRTLSVTDSCIIKVEIIESNKNYVKVNAPLSQYDEMLKDVIINFEQALQYRSKNPYLSLSDTTGSWIDYSKEYVKLAIPNDNIYRITYNDLTSYGVNPENINPKTLKIFNKGLEQPIYVHGEDDNIFNTTDYVEFYAEKNYTYQNHRNIVPLGHDYIQFMNRYTDTSIVWLSWGGSNGRRVNIISNTPSPTADTISTHLVKIHLEQNLVFWYYDPVIPRVQLPFWQENKTFTWMFVGNSGSVSASFTARDFVPNTPVNIIARLISYASSGNINAHRHGLSLNSTNPQDTIVHNYKQTVNFSRTYNSSQLVNGNNIIRIFGLPSQASFHQSLLDWIDIEYSRRNVLFNDTLLINVPDNVPTSLRVVAIENVTNPSNLIVYKVKPVFKKITGFSTVGTNPSTIYFIDTVSSGDKYYVTRVTKVSTPLFKKKKFFVNLRNNSRAADYIIITNRVLESSSNQYKNFITTNYSQRVELVYDEDIYDEFSYGMLSAESIRSFLVSAKNNWVPPSPSYLTLIGDANYDYKDVITPAPTPRKKNLLTSFGNPVSDVWYVMWDSVNVHFPQMFVGRIPANNDQQVISYLQKHQSYLQRRYDIFNKSFIFFSGGDATKPNELNQIKEANDFVMNNFVRSAPVFGNATHFYKTINPPSNFGPYSLAEVQRVIDEGGLFISYIGHSGTRTWDNSISEVEHLKNKYNNRSPLISDFGCSTGKFAEPDVDAFGELFVCQSPYGQAISYLGNSSWGYLSTSLRFPRYFYQILTQDSIKMIGRAHNLAKIRQLNETGTGDVNRVFTYCNLLLGDPIIGLRVPEKPNFFIDETKIKLITEQPDDRMDSVTFRIVLQNLGIVNGDSVRISIKDFYQDSTIFSLNLKRSFVKFSDTLLVTVPVRALVGNRRLEVKIDPNNEVFEIYEDDNEAIYEYVVNSTSLTALDVSTFFNTSKDYLDILNPFIKIPNNPERMILQLSRFRNFSQVQTFTKDFDTLFSRIVLSQLLPNQRYFYRMRIDEANSFWSQPKSFVQEKPEYQVFVNSNEDESRNFKYFQTVFDTISNSWKLNTQTITLKILSGGGHDGAFGSIQWNGLEQLPNTYYWGLATAIIDSLTLKPTFIRYFNVPDPGVSDSLTNYVNNLPPNTLIAMTISADAAQGPLGWTAGTPPRNAIKTLGSRYIDSIVYREGWSILGKKGAAIGTVPEDYRKLFAGVATVEVSKTVTYDSGYVVFPELKYAKQWNYIKFQTEVPQGASLSFTPLGVRRNGQVDTLFNLTTTSDSIDISSIDARMYPSLKIIAKLSANQLKQSPKIFSMGANYQALPELAVNYQTVHTDKDTIWQGGKVNFFAKVYNVGKSTADTVRVNLELIKNDNTSFTLIDTVYYNFSTQSHKTISYEYFNTILDGYGNMNFKLSIDPNNSVNEFLENNNIFYKPFYVKRDTATTVSSSALNLRFNGREIDDWDYVEPESKVQVTLNYPVWFPVSDTAAIQIFIDGRRIYAEKLSFDYDTIERKIDLEFDASFSSGEHHIRIFTKDVYGRLANRPLLEKYFKVSQDVELLQVYNYPNPFKNGTHFTFVLTQVPEEVNIKIYTVAGRLIKEINVSQSNLTTNFNKIFWDGKDNDGDELANGVYLYKISVKKGNRTQSTFQKLAVLK
jgi:hypothetical protein